MEIERELRIVQGYGRRSEERNEDKDEWRWEVRRKRGMEVEKEIEKRRGEVHR